jgi:hypothetical protein
MIKNRQGSSFAFPIIIGGVVLTIIGLISAIENPLIGLFLVIIGSFFWSGSYGFQINPETDKFREYGSFYGIRSGKWKPLNSTPFISILRGKSGTRIHSMSNRSTADINEFHQVCLLSETHRTRYTVKKFKSKEQALEYAESLSSQLNKPIVKFNPVVSQRTRNRRRK